MPTKDGFNPDQPFPLFLLEHPEPQGIGTASDRALFSSRMLKVSILIAAAIALGIATLSVSVGNPATLFADITASLLDRAAPQPGSDQSTPAIQATADTQLPPTAKDEPTREEVAAAEPAGQKQTENSEPQPEALFRQFQAWAAEKDAQALDPAQPVQDAPAQVEQNVPAQVAEKAPAQVTEKPRRPLRVIQKHRYYQPASNARAEMLRRNPRPMGPRAQNEQGRVASAQVAGAPNQPVQGAEPPSFLQGFGLRN